MNGLERLAGSFLSIADNITSISERSIDETKPEFIDLNKSQLVQGLNSEGISMGSYKSKTYELKKLALYPESEGRKNYKLQGNYYSGIVATVKDGKINITSTDEKTKWLEKDNDKRFGLNNENLSIYVNQNLSPVLIKNILSALTF